MTGRAWFSDCGAYRYALLRCIDLGMLADEGQQQRCLNVVMLNPSTADAVLNDPTITRCIGYAKRWGYGELMVTNLFAFRATDPRDLKRVDDPVGPENDEYIRKVAAAADMVLVAWGSHGGHRGRDEQVRHILADIGKDVHCLTVTAKGQPGHPLYLAASLQPVVYRRHVEVPS